MHFCVKSHALPPRAVTETEYCVHVPGTPVLRCTRMKYLDEWSVQCTAAVGPQPTSPAVPSALVPSTHHVYDVTFVPPPDGVSEQVAPRMTSKTNSEFDAGAANAIVTWYEFVELSVASTVWNDHTSTSVSDDRVPPNVTGAP